MQEFSGLYKEMCEKAIEIQTRWNPQKHDCHCQKGDWKDGPASYILTDVKKEDVEDSFVWLPLDDELLERILSRFRHPEVISNHLNKFERYIQDHEE